MLKIRKEDFDKIFYHCKMEDPIEACGILAGEVKKLDGIIIKKIMKVYICINELKSSTEYRINPEEQFRIFHEIDDLNLDLIGFYHSHPKSPSSPSTTDLIKANYPDASYIIISLCPLKLSSWIFEDKEIFKEEEILIED